VTRIRKWLAIVVALLLLASFAIWQAPARGLLQLVQSANPGLTWSTASGSAWNGRAENVYWNGLALGAVHWRLLGLERLANLQSRWAVRGDSAQYSVDGRVSLAGGELAGIGPLRAHVPAAWIDLSHAVPFVYLTGTFEMDLDAVRFSGGYPTRGAGTVRWTGAGLGGLVSEPLGDIGFDIHPPPAGTGDLLLFDFASRQPTDIDIAGEGRLQGNAYQVQLRLQVSPRRADLVELLGGLGRPGADGSIHLEWQGALFPDRGDP
jgi:hypothetical protein